jgi:agmatinase
MLWVSVASVLLPATACAYAAQKPIQPPHQNSFIANSIFRHDPQVLEAAGGHAPLHTYDSFTQDVPFQGIATFAHLNLSNCFSGDDEFDIAIVGAPFDLGVTYRPGARFGPAGTRMGSRRLSPSMAYRYGALQSGRLLRAPKDSF